MSCVSFFFRTRPGELSFGQGPLAGRIGLLVEVRKKGPTALRWILCRRLVGSSFPLPSCPSPVSCMTLSPLSTCDKQQTLMEFLVFSPLPSAGPSAHSSTFHPGSALLLPQSARLPAAYHDLHTAHVSHDAHLDDAASPGDSITIPPLTAAAMLATATLRSSPLLQPGSAVEALGFFRESLSGMVVSVTSGLSDLWTLQRADGRAVRWRSGASSSRTTLTTERGCK